MTDAYIPTAPVVAISTQLVAALDAAIVRFDHLTHPDQPFDQPTPSPAYLLTRLQLEELARQIERALQRLRTDAPRPSPDGTH